MRASPYLLGAAGLTLALGVMGCSGAAANNSAGTPASPPTAGRGPVTGTVTVKDGTKVVCVMTIKAGQGTCRVNTAHYAPGTLRFDASYSGGPGYKPSHGSVSLKLTKPASTAHAG